MTHDKKMYYKLTLESTDYNNSETRYTEKKKKKRDKNGTQVEEKEQSNNSNLLYVYITLQCFELLSKKVREKDVEDHVSLSRL